MNYYDLLEVDVSATPEQIKNAYRKLSMKHHPDRGGDKEHFVKVQLAYETLIDSEKRKHYDEYGEPLGQLLTLRDRAIAELHNLMGLVIDELSSHGYGVNVSPLDVVKSIITKKRNETIKAKKLAIKANRNMVKMSRKFGYNSDNRIPESIINGKRMRNVGVYKQCRQAIQCLNIIEELLSDYSYADVEVDGCMSLPHYCQTQDYSFFNFKE